MANRRFEMHHYRQALVRMRLGDSDRQIAKSGLMGRTKASAFRQLAAAQGWLSTDQPVPDEAALAAVLGGTPDAPAASASAIEPYREEVTRWWQQGIQGTTIHQALVRKYDFAGHYSSVRRFLRGLKNAHPDATMVLDFAPGEAAQVDFGAGPKIVEPLSGEVAPSWVFVMTLAWSRHQYAEIVRDQTVATWLACHRRAFRWFGGVPTKLLIDNAKCAIIRACYYDPAVHRSYADCAEGYGFLLSPCPPRDPKKKGRVESGVKYIKRSFLPLREFHSLADANRQLHAWVLGTAGNRLHGTTHERPLTRFAEVERHVLKPLPDVVPQPAVWARAKLHPNCHLTFEKAYYSAPYRYVRTELWIHALDTTVEIYHEHQLVALHPRQRRAGLRSTVAEHLPPDAVAYLMRDPQWCRQQAQQIGPCCLAVVEQLFAHRVLDNLRAAQGVVGLRKRFGPERLEAACARALHFDDPKYRTVKTILEKGLDQPPQPEPQRPLAAPYTGKGRFSRNTRQMLRFDPPQPASPLPQEVDP